MLAPAVYCLSRSRRLAPAHQSSPPIGIQVFAPTIRTDERTQPRARTATLLDTFQRVLALGARKVAPPDVKARWQIERSDIDCALGGGRKRRSRHGESHWSEQQPCPTRRSPSAADFLMFSTDLDFGQGVRTANRLTTGQSLGRPPGSYPVRKSFSDRSDSPSPADEPDHEQDERDHQQDIDEIAQCVSADQTEQPQDQQDHSNRKEHRSLLPCVQHKTCRGKATDPWSKWAAGVPMCGRHVPSLGRSSASITGLAALKRRATGA